MPLPFTVCIWLCFPQDFTHLFGVSDHFFCFQIILQDDYFSALFLCQIGVLGVTAGAHRLWSHRAFKAKLPLEITLMLLQTMAFQVITPRQQRHHQTSQFLGLSTFLGEKPQAAP